MNFCSSLCLQGHVSVVHKIHSKTQKLPHHMINIQSFSLYVVLGDSHILNKTVRKIHLINHLRPFTHIVAKAAISDYCNNTVRFKFERIHDLHRLVPNKVYQQYSY